MRIQLRDRSVETFGGRPLIDASGQFFGPWAATGTPGQGGVPNANWVAEPDVTLPPGDYTVYDSDPSTWAQNDASGGAGMIWIHGRYE
jgi:hypothetical protein